MNLFDSHCHLENGRFAEDLPEVMARMKDAGVNRCILAGSDMETSEQIVKMASEYPDVYGVVGIHPHDAKTWTDDCASRIAEWVKQERIVGVGENGLDYFTSVPARFQPQDGKWRIAPYYHLFGSDELSQRAPVFQSRMPQPYIKLNPADAAKLGVNAGTRVSFSYDGNTVTLPVEIAEGLTAGQVGLPMGMSGIAPVLAGAHLEDLKEAQQ